MKPLPRVIGVGGLAFSAVNIIIGSGIFGLPSIAAADLGAAAILAYAVCAVLVTLVGLCLAEAGSRVGNAGGLYAYARVPFGPVLGGVAGTLLWFANAAASSAAVANLLMDTLATVTPALGGTVWRCVLIVSLFAILAVVNVRGAQHGVRLSVALAFVKIAPLILLVIASAFAVKGPNLKWAGTPSLTAVGQGTVVVFFAFMGIETALCTSGEVSNPARTVPRATFVALVIVTLLYGGLQLAAQGVLGARLPSTDAPLVATATVVLGAWGGSLLIAATLLSGFGYLAADVLCSPRAIYALAENGQLPRHLALVHERYNTPWLAITAYAVLCAVLALSGSFRQLVILASSGTLVLYLICSLGLLRLRARHIATEGNPFRAPGGAFVPLAAAALIIWLLSTLQRSELLGALALVAISGTVYLLQTYLVARRSLPGLPP